MPINVQTKKPDVQFAQAITELEQLIVSDAEESLLQRTKKASGAQRQAELLNRLYTIGNASVKRYIDDRDVIIDPATAHAVEASAATTSTAVVKEKAALAKLWDKIWN